MKIAAGYAGHTQVLGLFDRSVSVDQERTTIDHITFTIGLLDYDSERKRLETLGLNVEVHAHEWINWRSLYFHDPEGNRVELVCYDESLSASKKLVICQDFQFFAHSSSSMAKVRKLPQDRNSRHLPIAEIPRRLSTLTSREHEVLCRLIAGQINKQIAADLGTVEKTIKVHRGRVMKKMRANSLAELVTIVVRIGIRAPGRRANMATDSTSSTCVRNIDGPQNQYQPTHEIKHSNRHTRVTDTGSDSG